MTKRDIFPWLWYSEGPGQTWWGLLLSQFDAGFECMTCGKRYLLGIFYYPHAKRCREKMLAERWARMTPEQRAEEERIKRLNAERDRELEEQNKALGIKGGPARLPFGCYAPRDMTPPGYYTHFMGPSYYGYSCGHGHGHGHGYGHGHGGYGGYW